MIKREYVSVVDNILCTVFVPDQPACKGVGGGEMVDEL